MLSPLRTVRIPYSYPTCYSTCFRIPLGAYIRLFCPCPILSQADFPRKVLLSYLPYCWNTLFVVLVFLPLQITFTWPDIFFKMSRGHTHRTLSTYGAGATLWPSLHKPFTWRQAILLFLPDNSRSYEQNSESKQYMQRTATRHGPLVLLATKTYNIIPNFTKSHGRWRRISWALLVPLASVTLLYIVPLGPVCQGVTYFLLDTFYIKKTLVFYCPILNVLGLKLFSWKYLLSALKLLGISGWRGARWDQMRVQIRDWR